MKDTQDLNFLASVSGSRVHAVEQGVGMGGGGAKFAGQIGDQVVPNPVHPGIEDQPVCHRFNLVDQPVGGRWRGHAGEVPQISIRSCWAGSDQITSLRAGSILPAGFGLDLAHVE